MNAKDNISPCLESSIRSRVASLVTTQLISFQDMPIFKMPICVLTFNAS
jgi:hypothetical protein